MRNPIDRLIDGVRQHAQRNSSQSGWAFVCDALTDEHLAEMLAGCSDPMRAIDIVYSRVENVLVRRETVYDSL